MYRPNHLSGENARIWSLLRAKLTHPSPILCRLDTGAGSLNEWSVSVTHMTGVTIHRHTDIHTGPTAYTL